MALDDQLCFALYAATHAIQRLYRPLLDAAGLTYPQYLVLLLLWEQDGRSITEIGAHLDLNSATLTPLVKRLERAGHVERRRSTEDERRLDIRLTRQGRALRSKVADITHEVTCAAHEASTDAPALLSELRILRAQLPDGLD